MADAQPMAPTDAEIVALADETRTAEGGANGYILPISFARAVLAKWGAQPVVPAGYALVLVEPTPEMLSAMWVPPNSSLADTYSSLSDAYNAMLAAAPQPMTRKPLTDEQIWAMLNKHPPEDVCGWSYRMGIDDAELHHGITGGQHGD